MKSFLENTGRGWLIAAVVCVTAVAASSSIALAGSKGPSHTLGSKVGDIWASQGSSTIDVTGFTNHTVTSITLPKGTFRVSAKVSVKNSAGSGNFECRIRDTGGNLDDGQTTTAAAFKGDTVALQALVAYATTTTVFLTCDADAGAVSWWHLDAVKIGTVR